VPICCPRDSHQGGTGTAGGTGSNNSSNNSNHDDDNDDIDQLMNSQQQHQHPPPATKSPGGMAGIRESLIGAGFDREKDTMAFTFYDYPGYLYR
jgi:hypothetical protein